MKKINSEIIKDLIEKSKQSPRLRSHFNIHDDLAEDVQRLLICLQTGSYVRPHFHPEAEKKELIILIQGECGCFTFDESGSVSDFTILSKERGDIACEFPPQKFHSLVCLKPDTIVIEVKRGPYKPLESHCFASWAPPEGGEGVGEYLNKLIKVL